MRRSSILFLTASSCATAAGALLAAQVSSSAAGADLCTGGQATGTGLRGAYYSSDPRTHKPALVRLDAQISDGTLRDLPASFGAMPPSTVRWCGWIRPIVSGQHRFGTADAPMKMTIDQQPVPTGQPVALEAGKAYAIWMELTSPQAAGPFRLQWTPPFGATYDIPPTVLFPPVETVSPGC